MANLSKAEPIYQVPQSGKMPTRSTGKLDPETGLPIVEKVTKLPNRVALSPQGNLVRIPLSNAPAVQRKNTEYGRNLAEWKPQRGFIWADECPVETGALKRSQSVQLFGDNVEPCLGKFDQDTHCKHILDLQERRQRAHNKTQQKREDNAASLEQLLKDDLLARKRAELEARAEAELKPRKSKK